MKLVLLLIAMAAKAMTVDPPPLSAPAPVQDDLQDIWNLIPMDKIKQIAEKYLATDQEVQNLVLFFQSPEYRTMVDAIKATPQWQRLTNYLRENAGVDIEMPFKELSKIFHELEVPGKPRAKRNLNEFVQEVEENLPLGKMIAMVRNKMENSDSFKNFLEVMSRKEVSEMVRDVLELPETRALFEKFESLGFNVKETFKLTASFLNWEEDDRHRKTRSVRTDDETFFVMAMPTNAIQAVVKQHLEKDPGFVGAMAFFHGPQWSVILHEVLKQPEWKAVTRYLFEHRVDYLSLFEYLEGFVKHCNHTGANQPPNLRPFLKDLSTNVLSLGDFLDLYNYHMFHMPYLAEIYTHISSLRFRDLSDDLLDAKGTKHMMLSLSQIGVDCNGMVLKLRKWLRWERDFVNFY